MHAGTHFLTQWSGGGSPGIKSCKPLVLTSAASPEKSLLPHDGSVRLAFSSSHRMLLLTAESNHSCRGWAWQQLHNSYSRAAVRHGEAGRGKGQQKGKQKCLVHKRQQKDFRLERASQHSHKGYCSLRDF